MPKDKNNAVAGLVNFMRNIGASVGTSVVTTMLARRDQFHQERLGSNLTSGNLVFRSTLRRSDAATAAQRHERTRRTNGAYGRLYQNLQVQASTLSYIDTFWLLTLGRRRHVLHDVCVKEERSALRREGRCPLKTG